ncbi:thiosulfate oxidation carrier protein SoxY [Sulfurimonas microaerophilic]|uniref:thiosulfate oxidation carrier protein SoxY n=1 Tax=Sulfurimonas microaerophilic TaxID=3058392 RepID=UPI0027145F32|nr:thiosulfate oxidation carrier protein SoxY [Sulfurimonas sp. hsl 1-7]
MQRRDFFKKIGSVTAVAAVMPVMSFAADAKPVSPNKMSYETALNAITNGKTPKKSNKVSLKVPEIAENGAVVPVTVNVESPMTENDYVKSIHVLNTKNGNSRCIDVNLTPANGKAMFSTRIKLGGTQDVVAVVELSNGEFLIASQNVKVTIGGCG